MVRILLLVLTALFLIGSFGCKSDDSELKQTVALLMSERNSLQTKLDDAKDKLSAMEIDLNKTKADADAAREELNQLKSAPTPEPVVVTETKTEVQEVVSEYACGINCSVNGSMFVKLNGETKVTCNANKIEGYVFDHWEVNGEEQDSKAETLELNLSKITVVQAVFRERRTIKCINCHFQFLNEKGNASGKEFTEFDFEEEYTNAATKKKEAGGLINFYLFADVPKKQEIDYWLINGVKYQYTKDIQKFRVEGLDEATVYEVVFKGQGKTDHKTYYNVSCSNCTFSGGGNSNASSGKVAAGTTITITGKSTSSEADFWGNPTNVSRHFSKQTSMSGNLYVHSYSYTVNSDVVVHYSPVVN